ncbi:MAG: FAD-dependent oxidoreductase [Nanoarchaeota archaeon]|nr:FAD-dependent oxidoreductase [Nanoarchaeota archaeon]
MKKQKIIILGAGITGLVSAYYLSKNFQVVLIEKEEYLGGSASGFPYKDFILDFGPHKIYTELPGILDEVKKLTPLIKIRKKNSIYLRGNYYDFPLKITQIAAKMPITALKSFKDILFKSGKPDDSYENFLINRFGKTLYELSFRDYAFKVWNSNPWDLDRELAKRRVAVSGIFELIKSTLLKKSSAISAEYFYYPAKGMKQLIDFLEKEIRKNKGKILTNTKVSEIKIKNKKIECIKAGRKFKPDFVISTIPLDSLVSITSPNHAIMEYSKNLSYQKLNIIYFILNKPRALKDCWIFFPEARFLFQRVSEQKAFSLHTSPKNKTAIMVETTREVSENLVKAIIKQMALAKIAKKSDIEEYFAKSIPKAYPVYKKGFLHSLEKIEGFFDSIENFYLLGRQGLFNYNNIDQCWDMAIKVSEQIKNNSSKEDWQKIKKYFENYRIVD